MNEQQIKEFLEEERERLKERIKEFVDNDWNYTKLQTKKEYLDFLIKKINEEQTEYDLEDVEE